MFAVRTLQPSGDRATSLSTDLVVHIGGESCRSTISSDKPEVEPDRMDLVRWSADTQAAQLDLVIKQAREAVNEAVADASGADIADDPASWPRRCWPPTTSPSIRPQ